MVVARIYQPSRSVAQSGDKKKFWVLEFEQKSGARYREPLMNWVGNKDTTGQFTLKFSTAEEAERYATSQGIEYEIEYPRRHTIKQKSYADNFNKHVL